MDQGVAFLILAAAVEAVDHQESRQEDGYHHRRIERLQEKLQRGSVAQGVERLEVSEEVAHRKQAQAHRQV